MFATLRDQEVANVAQSMLPAVLRDGEYVYRQGDAGAPSSPCPALTLCLYSLTLRHAPQRAVGLRHFSILSTCTDTRTRLCTRAQYTHTHANPEYLPTDEDAYMPACLSVSLSLRASPCLDLPLPVSSRPSRRFCACLSVPCAMRRLPISQQTNSTLY